MRSCECGDSCARNAEVNAGNSRMASVTMPIWAKSKIGAFLSVLMATMRSPPPRQRDAGSRRKYRPRYRALAEWFSRSGRFVGRGDPALLDQRPRAAIFGAKHVRELLYQLEVLRRSQTEPSGDDHVGVGKVGLCRIAVRQERQHFVTISSSTSPSGCEMTRQTAPVTRSGIGITRGRTVAICGR